MTFHLLFFLIPILSILKLGYSKECTGSGKFIEDLLNQINLINLI